MSFFLLIAIAAGLLGIAISVPSCTETPETWSGQLYEISYVNALKRSYISYDRGSKMMKITDYRGAVLQTSLYNYLNMTLYVSENGLCTKSILTGEMPTFGTPVGAELDPNGIKYIGGKANGTGVLVYEFYGTDAKMGEYYLTYAPVFETQCIPLYVSYISTKNLLLQEFTNIIADLPFDPFGLPPGCKID